MKYIALENNGTYSLNPVDNVSSMIWEHQMSTTLSELKEMWEDAKIWNEVKQGKIQHDTGQYLAYLTLKNSPRKYTIEDIQQSIRMSESGVYMSEDDILTTLTKLPPQGLEVEIENNKIVKVYV